MQNNLFVNRLLIYTEEGRIAYDEEFHKGINIIRGHNSSGKSTITHFIFFALGGAFNNFVPEAKKCSTVYIEIEVNNAVISLKRNIEKDIYDKINSKSSLYFYWGSLEKGLRSSKDWYKFGYNSTKNTKSFSNVLFENMDLPIIYADNNITFYQILRLLYIDQESPTSSLFYYDQFDSQITRETVSEILLGLYSNDLYTKKMRLRTARKELESINDEIRVTKRFFKDPNSLDSGFLESKIKSLEEQISSIDNQITNIRNGNKTVEFKKTSKMEFENIEGEIINTRKHLTETKNKIATLNSEIEDTSYFIYTLKSKIEALRNSIKTRNFLDNIDIEFCPKCLSKIDSKANIGQCNLCKQEISIDNTGEAEARKIEQEISFQILESTQILEKIQRERIDYKSVYKGIQAKLFVLQQKQNSIIKDVKSYQQEVLDSLFTKKGFIEGESLQYRTMLEKATLYDELLDIKYSLKKEIELLDKQILQIEFTQNRLKVRINDTIKKEALYLLNNDLNRQDEFRNASEFYINYSNNIAFLSSKYAKYSASSNFYLKITARFAIFLASLSIPEMRFPRFIFADNMEDKGIEIGRAQNLQKVLIKRLNEFDSKNYQLIYTTSYITDELNESPYVVGEFYTETNRSLKNIS